MSCLTTKGIAALLCTVAAVTAGSAQEACAGCCYGGYYSMYAPYYATSFYAPTYGSVSYGPVAYGGYYGSSCCSPCGSSCGLCGGCFSCGTGCSTGCGLCSSGCGAGGCGAGGCGIDTAPSAIPEGDPPRPSGPGDSNQTFGQEDDWKKARPRNDAPPPGSNDRGRAGDDDEGSPGDMPPKPEAGERPEFDLNSPEADGSLTRDAYKLAPESVVKKRQPDSPKTVQPEGDQAAGESDEAVGNGEQAEKDAGKAEEGDEESKSGKDIGPLKVPLRNLDKKITWRSVPKRTRLVIRSRMRAPRIVRLQPRDNSGWQVIPKTKLVQK